jgi:hypothetical protein
MSTDNVPPIHDFDSEEELNEYLEKNRIELRNTQPNISKNAFPFALSLTIEII